MKTRGKNKKVISILAIISVIIVIMIGGVIAFLTDTKQVNNEFTIGKVDITLNEKNKNNEDFSDEDGKFIVANQEIIKIPTVTNNGRNPAYVYLTVEIPKVVLSEGAQKSELLSLIYKPTESATETETNTSNWEEITPAVNKENSIIRAFKYKTALPVGETTESLFTKVKINSGLKVNSSLPEGTEEIVKLEAYAIQTENLTIDAGWNNVQAKYNPFNN